MPYLISTTDIQNGHSLVRVEAPCGEILLAEIEGLFAGHPSRIARDLVLLARRQNPSAGVIVDGQAIDLCGARCPVTRFVASSSLP